MKTNHLFVRRALAVLFVFLFSGSLVIAQECGPSDGDFDNDGIPDEIDNCPSVFNPTQANDCEEKPDLIVTVENVSPADPTAGELVEIEFVVWNAWHRPGPGGCLFIDTDTSKTGDEELVPIRSLDSGSTQSHTIARTYRKAGVYQVYAEADFFSVVDEHDETNNSTTLEVVVADVSTKTPVCHLSPGNPGNAQLIEIGSKGNAVSAHLSHGDYLPIPEICDDGLDNDCDGVIDDSDPDCPSPVSCPCEGLWNEAINFYVSYPDFDPGWAPEVWQVCAILDVYRTVSGSWNEHSDTEETNIIIVSEAAPGNSCSTSIYSQLGDFEGYLFSGSAYISSDAEAEACVALHYSICGETRYDE